MKLSSSGALLIPLTLLLMTGCANEEPVAETSSVREPVAEGLSPEEIRQQAEPMSPEQAAELGIVDTTIHVEQLAGPEDTILTPDSLPPPGNPRP